MLYLGNGLLKQVKVGFCEYDIRRKGEMVFSCGDGPLVEFIAQRCFGHSFEVMLEDFAKCDSAYSPDKEPVASLNRNEKII